MPGPPNGPSSARVSATRHGVTGTKRRAADCCGVAGVVKDQTAELLALELSLAATRQKYSAPAFNAPGV